MVRIWRGRREWERRPWGAMVHGDQRAGRVAQTVEGTTPDMGGGAAVAVGLWEAAMADLPRSCPAITRNAWRSAREQGRGRGTCKCRSGWGEGL